MDSVYLNELERIQDELKHVEGMLHRTGTLYEDWDTAYDIVHACSDAVRHLRLSIREFQRDITGPRG